MGNRTKAQLAGLLLGTLLIFVWFAVDNLRGSLAMIEIGRENAERSMVSSQVSLFLVDWVIQLALLPWTSALAVFVSFPVLVATTLSASRARMSMVFVWFLLILLLWVVVVIQTTPKEGIFLAGVVGFLFVRLPAVAAVSGLLTYSLVRRWEYSSR